MTIEYKFVPVDSLQPNPLNPNKMSPRQFNMLVDNIAKVGFTDPIFVREVEGGLFRVIGGHHRLDAAKVLGMTEVPVSIKSGADFDEDQEKFQMMRHNMIRGKLDVEKFMRLYESVSEKYEADVLAEAFGFEESAALEKLIKQTQAGLPPELKEKFKEAAKEIKTVADLSLLLNRLFSEQGDTLSYSYMFMDFGGKNSIWVRMSDKDMKLAEKVAAVCVEKKRTFDAHMRAALQLIASGTMSPEFYALLDAAPEVVLPSKDVTTEEELENYLQ